MKAEDAPTASTPTPGVSIPYDGADVIVRAGLDLPGETLVVTFSSRSERGKGKFRPEGFGERFLRNEGVPHICFINKTNHWWQTPEFALAVSAIKSQGVLSRFRRVVTYGASMGGYGALLGAQAFDADLCLAFSPQFRVDGSIPLNPVWAADINKQPRVHEPFADGVSEGGKPEIVVIFDSLNAMDRAHAQALDAVHPSRFLTAPGASHSAALYLHEVGLLKEIVREGISGVLRPGNIRRRLRETRRADPRYWRGIGLHLASHGRSAAAIACHLRASDLVLSDPRRYDALLHDQIKLTLTQLAAGGEMRQALLLVQRYQSERPKDPRGYILASRLERGRGRAKIAVREAKQATVLSPQSAPAALSLAMALAVSEKVAAAAKHAAAAHDLKGANHRDWIEAATVFGDVGMLDEARKAVAVARGLRPSDPRALAVSRRLDGLDTAE